MTTDPRRLFGIDLRTLALFRVVLGIIILADIWNLAPYIADFYSDRGILTRTQAISWMAPERWSLHLLNGEPWVQAMLFVLEAVLALSLIVGYRTRWATAGLWLLTVSLINRNQIILQGGDQLLSLLLLWSIFLPLGARFSIDEALASSKTKPAQQPRPNAFFSAATLAILLQASYVYWIGALLKVSPEWVPDGTAVYYALHLDTIATPLGHWLREYEPLLKILTYYVWGLELAMPILVFCPFFFLPLRMTALVLLITMHVGFALFLMIGLFPAISIASLLLFLPSEFWDRLGRRFQEPKRRGLTIYYDEDCEFCFKTCLMFRSFCLPAETMILPVQKNAETRPLFEEHFTWVVIDYDGKPYIKWDAVNLILRRSILFRPLGWFLSLSPFRALGGWTYGWIARRRGAFGRIWARVFPYRRVRLRLTAPEGLFVVLAMLAVLVWNLMTLPRVAYDPPALMTSAFRFLQLDQRWNMFAPNPAKIDGWFVIAGTLEDGTPVDVMHRTPGAPSFDKPEYLSIAMGDYRWRKYFSRIFVDSYRTQLRNFARYQCRSWNRFTDNPVKLERFTVYFMRERTLPNYNGNALTRRQLLRWNCFA